LDLVDRVRSPVVELYTHRRREITRCGKPLLVPGRNRELVAVRYATGNCARCSSCWRHAPASCGG